MSISVAHLAKLLTYVSQRNTTVNERESDISLFHEREDGHQESLQAFLTRLDKHIRCSESCYAAALVYLDRITSLSRDITLNTNTVKKLFCTSLLLANQFLDDTAERTLQFARVAGYAPKDMAEMKIDFLFRIQFTLMITEAETRNYSDKLQGRYSTLFFVRNSMWAGLPRQTPSAPALVIKAKTMVRRQGKPSLARSATTAPSTLAQLACQRSANRKYPLRLVRTEADTNWFGGSRVIAQPV
eukprot:c10563_g1_i1.p1 GENE.c10563_g1_i1~~c10563_g1_i1.p1  ORF type:complete len:243 (+),score=43.54 c10563_g1_i1:130-858(+)